MDADVPWSRLDTDMLSTADISHVEEYLWTLQDQASVLPLSPDTTKTDCASLWPEYLYPDLYGKLLDYEHMAQCVNLHSARGYFSPTASEPPDAAGLTAVLFCSCDLARLSGRSRSSFGSWASCAATDQTHQDGPAANEYALLGDPDFEPLFADLNEPSASSDKEIYDNMLNQVKDVPRADTAIVNLEPSNVARDRPKQDAGVMGRKTRRKQGKGRGSHLRAEDEIASLPRVRRTAISNGWYRTNVRRKCLKARKRSRPELSGKTGGTKFETALASNRS
ncbi:hypothetical protein IQ07DRAFT_650808 [Pyrenochaeta sp. DS3sAY3a]|nr:hypothetical protein IQ07DRAFT_650808 [Pyrenochaeta sp. DS3sAY3a]